MDRRTLIKLTFAGALLTCATAEPEMAKPPAVKTITLGTVAPDFTLPGVDGKNHSLKDYSEAKALVLIFTCNHCPDARAARGKMIALHKDYRAKGVAVVAISGDQIPRTSRRNSQRSGRAR